MKWEEKNSEVLDTWNAYVRKEITTMQLVEKFPGRSFKAISDKVYRTRRRKQEDKTIIEGQLSLFAL